MSKISPELRELYVAYEQFVEPCLKYVAGQGAFRPRSEEGALQGLQMAVEYCFRRLLPVATLESDENSITLMLPAAGYTGRILDIPRYAITEGPWIAQVKNGERIELGNPSQSLREHRIELDADGMGEVPLFGDMLPFRIRFK